MKKEKNIDFEILHRKQICFDEDVDIILSFLTLLDIKDIEIILLGFWI